MNHSTKGQASTANQTGAGRLPSQASIFSTLLVLIVSAAIGSPAGSIALSVTVDLCRSTPTKAWNEPACHTIITISVLGACKRPPGESVCCPPGPDTVLH